MRLGSRMVPNAKPCAATKKERPLLLLFSPPAPSAPAPSEGFTECGCQGEIFSLAFRLGQKGLEAFCWAQLSPGSTRKQATGGRRCEERSSLPVDTQLKFIFYLLCDGYIYICMFFLYPLIKLCDV